MKILLHLNDPVDADEIHDLNDFIREQKLPGVLPSVVENQLTTLDGEVQIKSMSGADYMSIVQMILGSTVVAAGAKGLFDVIKNYFDIRRQKITSEADIEKAKIDATKIVLVVEDEKGNKKSVTLNALNDEERHTFSKTIDEIFNTR
jgi:hypothetical protein